MYKIEFIPTGHIFLLPDETANDLKSKFPDDYKILEKNGKKYRDKKIPQKDSGIKNQKNCSIRDLVMDK